MKNNKAVTLVALIITIIILLILAGVVIAMTIGDEGIINKSQQAVDKYSQEAAREQILQALFTLKMDKIANKENIDNIDDLLETAPGGGIKKYDDRIDTVEKSGNVVLITYDVKYIFEIDGDLNVTYVGKADGVIITANVSGGGWIKSSADSTVTISGKIRTTEGTITTASITKKGEAAENLMVAGDGTYTKTITSSGIYTIYAKDSNNKENSKNITANIQIDSTNPTIETLALETSRQTLGIKITVVGNDKNLSGEEESGIVKYIYTILPPSGVTLETNSGEFTSSETTIEVPSEGEYTVSIKAEDAVGNQSPASSDSVTVTEPKKIILNKTIGRNLI